MVDGVLTEKAFLWKVEFAKLTRRNAERWGSAGSMGKLTRWLLYIVYWTLCAIYIVE